MYKTFKIHFHYSDIKRQDVLYPQDTGILKIYESFSDEIPGALNVHCNCAKNPTKS